MTDEEYFPIAASWAVDAQLAAARTARRAWLVAGIAVAVALFEAVALAMLTPLKTVQPVTLLVDRQTGFVQALDPLSPRRITADEALINSLLAQYVAGREGFDRATVAAEYRRVALWSAGSARQSYLGQMPASNPESPFQRYTAGTVIDATVKSVSHLNPGVALVRFDTRFQDNSGRAVAPQQWVAIVRYRFVDAPMRFEDRLANPLGFQVVSYRRDAEAPPPVILQAAPPEPSVPAAVVTTTTVVGRPAAAAPAQPAPVQQSRSTVQTPPQKTAKRPTPIGSVERREIPINNLPMGSPLSPGGALVAALPSGQHP